ncbi:hypothetical protein KCP75_00895 [Salmonella enterica subsp. enterica]|nr:hypothetical protein KCP75_00895 [Salmonella enterica subsp. enterica]
MPTVFFRQMRSEPHPVPRFIVAEGAGTGGTHSATIGRCKFMPGYDTQLGGWIRKILKSLPYWQDMTLHYAARWAVN